MFIEHNGLLVRRGCEALVAPALRKVARRFGHVELAGIGGETLTAARVAGYVRLRRSRPAPFVDLRRLGTGYLESLSANTRAQIRRAMRYYGPDLTLRRASTLDEAEAFFAELIELHQAAWRAKGRPGAFADPFARRFHAALIRRALPLGEADLLRVEVAGRAIGLLYNFLRDGTVFSYQSGFRYDPERADARPGLVTHALAIAHYASAGQLRYDLLAGEDRYKSSLASEREILHWASLHRLPPLASMATDRLRPLVAKAKSKFRSS